MQAGRIWSYRSFVQLIDERRIWLDDAGVLTGQSVVILVRQQIHTWLVLLALRAMGVSTISISQVNQIKDLSVNNIHRQFDLAQGDDGRREVIECQEGVLQLLIAHQ